MHFLYLISFNQYNDLRFANVVARVGVSLSLFFFAKL